MIVGATYMQILTRTLPSTINSLEKLGYKLNVHYFIGRKPPAKFKLILPYEPPLKFDHYLFFWREGVGFHLVSQDGGGGSSRGLNVDGIIADESLLLNKEKFNKEASATNRGNLAPFSHIPWHHGIFHFSSMPYGELGKWLLDYGEYYNDDHNFINNKVIDLQLDFIDNKDKQFRLETWRKILILKQELKYVQNGDGLLYSEANVFDNIKNVGIKYIEQQRRELTTFEFLTEMLNKRPTSIEGGFYAKLNEEIHGYSYSYDNDYLNGLEYDFDKIKSLDSRVDADCVKSQPLRISIDWGSAISSLSVGQLLPKEYRLIKDFYVKHPKLIKDLADNFCDYYQYHPCKVVNFIIDVAWGNRRMPDSRQTFNEQFAARLKNKGWRVNIIDLGVPVDDQSRYICWHQLLSEDDEDGFKFRINLNNCKQTYVSMSQAPAKEGSKGIEKDKSSERSKSIAPEDATHFSDTADQHILSIQRDMNMSSSILIPYLQT